MTESTLFALDTAQIIQLLVCSLAAGIGISAVGPGGVLITIALYLFTSMSPALVAGTAIVSHIATGLAGTIGYARAGHFSRPFTRRAAVQLSAAAVVGAPIGMWINTQVSRDGFGLVLGLLALVTGLLILHKQRISFNKAKSAALPDQSAGSPAQLSLSIIIIIGLAVAILAAMFGLGGPMLCVPLLVIAGTPMLSSLAAAQAQSIVIAAIGTLAYFAHGSIDWPMAIFVMAPQVVGVMLGVKIAHSMPTIYLKYALALALIGLAPYLAFG